MTLLLWLGPVHYNISKLRCGKNIVFYSNVEILLHFLPTVFCWYLPGLWWTYWIFVGI